MSKDKIAPVVMFPFSYSRTREKHVVFLHKFLEGLNNRRYYDPIWVVNKQTSIRRGGDMAKLPVVLRQRFFPIWSVDTCQMWLAGLGAAFDKNSDALAYWLVPGDFEYNEKNASKLESLPKEFLKYKTQCQICLGEIVIDHDNSKHLIDTHGTYGLLYNWFPKEAVIIKAITNKPRTEHFVVSRKSLEQNLSERWYGYEQTLLFLLRVLKKKGVKVSSVGSASMETAEERCEKVFKAIDNSIRRVKLRGVVDNPLGPEKVRGAIEQIERMERLLKQHWRESNKADPDWREKYRILSTRSEEIRNAALTVLGQYLDTT